MESKSKGELTEMRFMVEATKQVYGAVPVGERSKARRRIVPVPAGVTPRN